MKFMYQKYRWVGVVILMLLSFITGTVTEAQLNVARSAMCNFTGRNCKEADTSLDSAADVLGNVNNDSGMANYNVQSVSSVGQNTNTDNSNDILNIVNGDGDPENNDRDGGNGDVIGPSVVSLDSATYANLKQIIAKAIGETYESPNTFFWINISLLLILIGLVAYLIFSLLKHQRRTAGRFKSTKDDIKWARAELGALQNQQEASTNTSLGFSNELQQIKSELTSLSRAVTANSHLLKERLEKPKSSASQPPAPAARTEERKPIREPKVTKVLFADHPRDEYFNQLFADINQDVAYKIEVLEDSDKARYAPVNDPTQMRRAIIDENDILATGCMYTHGRPREGQTSIIVVKHGTLSRSGDGWKIQERAEIRFR